MPCCGDILWCSIDLTMISSIITWHSILREMEVLNEKYLGENKIAYIIQLKINIVEACKLLFGRWIAVGSKWNDASASSLIMIVNDTFGTWHIRILKTIGKDHNICAGLQTLHSYINVSWIQTSECHTLMGTSIVSQVISARVNWIAVHPSMCWPRRPNQSMVVLSITGRAKS